MAVHRCAKKGPGFRWPSRRMSPRPNPRCLWLSRARKPRASRELRSRKWTQATETGRCAKKPSAKHASPARAAQFRVAHRRRKCLPRSLAWVSISDAHPKIQQSQWKNQSREASHARDPSRTRQRMRLNAEYNCSSIITWARRMRTMRSACWRIARPQLLGMRKSNLLKNLRSSARKIQCRKKRQSLPSSWEKKRIWKLSNCATRVKLKPSKRSLRLIRLEISTEGVATGSNRRARRIIIQIYQIPTLLNFV